MKDKVTFAGSHIKKKKKTVEEAEVETTYSQSNDSLGDDGVGLKQIGQYILPTIDQIMVNCTDRFSKYIVLLQYYIYIYREDILYMQKIYYLSLPLSLS